MSSLLSHALMLSPATVSFTLYVTADLLDGVHRVALVTIVQLTIVLRIHVVKHDDETIRPTIFSGGTLDGVVVGRDNVVADGQRGLFGCFVLQDAVVNLPRAADGLRLPCLGQRVAMCVANLRVPSGIPHAALTRRDESLMHTGGQCQCEEYGQ